MFEIERPDKDSGLGIYAQSVAVKPKEYKELAQNMVEWFRENNGKLKGEFSKGFAIAHCQLENVPNPIKLFVVEDDLVQKNVPEIKKQNNINCFFEAPAIFNAEILEAPKKVTRKVPKRNVSKPKNGKVEVSIVHEDKELDNIMTVPEACLSFPQRTKKNVQRYHTVKVRYQYLEKNLLGIEVVRTFEGNVEGLKAHVLQHECQHFDGKNMYYDPTT
jgi:peptide deformylase